MFIPTGSEPLLFYCIFFLDVTHSQSMLASFEKLLPSGRSICARFLNTKKVWLGTQPLTSATKQTLGNVFCFPIQPSYFAIKHRPVTHFWLMAHQLRTWSMLHRNMAKWLHTVLQCCSLERVHSRNLYQSWNMDGVQPRWHRNTHACVHAHKKSFLLVANSDYWTICYLQ